MKHEVTLYTLQEIRGFLNNLISGGQAFIERETGITKSYLSLIKTGKADPALATLIKLNDFFNKYKNITKTFDKQ